MATIKAHKRADGSIAYRVRFRLRPGTNPVSETFETAADAKQFADLVAAIGGEAAREMRSISTQDAAIITLQTALEEYCTHVSTYAARGTAEDYRRVAKRTWLTFFTPALPIQALTQDAVANWVAWQRNRPTRRGGTYSTKSIKNAQGLLSSVLQFQVERGRITANVAKAAKLPRDLGRAQITFLSAEQFTRISAHLAPVDAPLIAFLYGTGARWSEATALKASDFALEAAPKTVVISKAWKASESGRYIGSPKSRAGYRTITLPEAVAREVEPLVREAAVHGGFVFHAVGDPSRGREYSSTRRRWKKTVNDAGIGLDPRIHDLRHSHASALIARGIPLPVIQRRLGHESIKTTVDVYGHLSPEAWAGAAEAMDLEMAPAFPEIEI